MSKKISIIERYDKPFEYGEVLFCLFWAFLYLKVWLGFGGDDPETISRLCTLIIFEFVMVHSGIFMALFPAKISLFLFFPFYGLFAWGLSSAVGTSEILYIYLFTVLNRMRFAFFNTSSDLQVRVFKKSWYAALSYFLILIFFALIADYIPTFAITPEYLQQIGYDSKFKSDLSEHIFLSIGFAYYLIMAFINLKIIKSE